MQDEAKTKEQLIEELHDLRQHVAALVTSDVQRQQAEQKLRDTEETYRTLVENASDAILILQNGKTVYRNPAFAKLMGYTQEEARQVTRSFIDFVAPENQARLAEYYQKQLQGEAMPEQYEADILSKDGQRITVEIKPRVIEYRGRPATMVLMGDITERKWAEEALRESEKRYRHLVERGQGLICTHDFDGVLLSVNPAVAQALGCEPDKMVGRNLQEILAPSVQHLLDDYLERIRQNPTDSGLMRLVTKNGEERIWLYRNARYEEAGKSPYVLSHAQDITERVQAEKMLRESEEKYRTLYERSKDAVFVAGPEPPIVDTHQAVLDLFGYNTDTDLLSYTIKLALDVQKIEVGHEMTLEELRRSEEELLVCKSQLEKLKGESDDTNKALAVLARHLERAQKETVEQIAANMRSLIAPIIENLRKDKNLEIYEPQLAILLGYIGGMASTSLTNIRETDSFSSRELQIANMIKNSMTDGEIAMNLYISPATVKTHRRNIRRKLNISGTEKNLNTYLQSR